MTILDLGSKYKVKTLFLHMELIETGFKGLILIKPKVFIDERGYFLESFNLDLDELIGKNTKQALQNGATIGTLLEIESFIERISEKYRKINIIF